MVLVYSEKPSHSLKFSIVFSVGLSYDRITSNSNPYLASTESKYDCQTVPFYKFQVIGVVFSCLVPHCVREE